MSTHDSLPRESNTLRGTPSREQGLMLDLYDHGPLLMVVAGQFIEADSFSMNVDHQVDQVNFANSIESKSVVNASQITLSIETSSPFTYPSNEQVSDIRLWNNKHELLFENGIIAKCTGMAEDGPRTIEIVCTDYEASTDWYNRYTS